MALKGTKVLEIVGLAPAPFCGLSMTSGSNGLILKCISITVLSDFGADVLRIDRPFNRQPECLKRGKKSALIDLKSIKGKQIFKRLCNSADVLIEPFRPGVMEKLDLGPKVLMADNQKLIYARLTGYGQSGHLAQKAGHDINYLAISGILSKLGNNKTPSPPINILGDFAGGGLICALGICLALIERTKSGKGQVIDSNITEGSAYVSSWIWESLSPKYSFRDIVWLKPNQRESNTLDGGSPFYRCYQTKDNKFMAVGALEPQFYDQLVKVLQLDTNQFDRNDIQNWDQLTAKFAQIFATKSQEEWISIFDKVDACVTPVLDFDSVHNYEHNKNRNSFFSDGVPKPSPILSRTPAVHNNNSDSFSDDLHTKQVLLNIGYSQNEIQEFANEGVIELEKCSSKL